MTYLDEIKKELYEKCEDIPFGNSLYQTECFVLNDNFSDGRALRTIAINMSEKHKALTKLQFDMARLQIDIEELDSKIYALEPKSFERRRFEIDKAEKLESIDCTRKLAKDAIYELEYMRSILKKLPKMNRQEFEAQEEKHYVEHITRQAMNVAQPIRCLHEMGMHGEVSINIKDPRMSDKLDAGIDKFLKDFKPELTTDPISLPKPHQP